MSGCTVCARLSVFVFVCVCVCVCERERERERERVRERERERERERKRKRKREREREKERKRAGMLPRFLEVIDVEQLEHHPCCLVHLVHFTESVHKVVLQKSIPIYIRQLILYCY